MESLPAFVLPKSFLNCLYYNKTRKYITSNYTILDITYCHDDYLEAKQETITLMVQNKKPTTESCYSLNINESLLFGDTITIQELKVLYSGATFLDKLGFNLHVGTVVWNQCKSILTDDTTKTRLIYSSDIKQGTLIQQRYKNIEKKNFIAKPGLTKPVLVLNRGYGVGNYNFEYCLIDGTQEYLIENHLICIDGGENKESYDVIIQSFQNPKTTRFIELYFGNNAINTTELYTMFPIYLS